MSSLLNLKPNIGVYTDPQHNLWIDEADPSSADIQSGAVPAEGEVVVEIRSTGICGSVPSCKQLQGWMLTTDFARLCSSDVHFWHAGRIGPMVVDDKHILGHESAGEVARMTSTYPYRPFALHIIGHCRPSVRNASKAGRPRRDRARYPLPHLRAVSQRPLQRLRARALSFYSPRSRSPPSLYRASGLVVPQALAVPFF
jgi:hypothetical protein